MKKYLFLSLLISSSSFAATIKFSEELIPLQVNEKKIKQSFFRSIDEVEVVTGQHKVKLKYKDLYDIDYDEHEVVESEPFWVKVNINDDDGKYLISIPRPSDVEEAKAYIKQPYANIQQLDKTHSKTILQAFTEQTESKNEPKLTPHITNKQEHANVNNKTEAASKKQVNHNSKMLKSVSPSALSMLEFWWAQASEAEKQTFLANKKGS